MSLDEQQQYCTQIAKSVMDVHNRFDDYLIGNTKIFLRAELFAKLTNRTTVMQSAGRILLRYLKWRRNIVNLKMALKKTRQLYVAHMLAKELAWQEAHAADVSRKEKERTESAAAQEKMENQRHSMVQKTALQRELAMLEAQHAKMTQKEALQIELAKMEAQLARAQARKQQMVTPIVEEDVADVVTIKLATLRSKAVAASKAEGNLDDVPDNVTFVSSRTKAYGMRRGSNGHSENPGSSISSSACLISHGYPSTYGSNVM